MTEDKDNLDLLFAQAREKRPELPDDLAVRILTDAETVRLERRKPDETKTNPLWTRVLAGLGGWQGMGGLVAASMAGVWIGFSAPAFLPDPANYIYAQDVSFVVADLSLDTSFLEDAE
ncbi:hypothetical protein [Ruegeria sp. Ofav3-42]|uniref:hypothetical protein n=1 Tax=Ruegeria sp. Ofav3-42 TaxID=2917759 RepID=UPI001EF6367E|nr:hypothetical protein [Ruegeria sp. Ofav3-42]MCG7519094.1 hypothetical protein [Ruegeria sp. Ofav3-42]